MEQNIKWYVLLHPIQPNALMGHSTVYAVDPHGTIWKEKQIFRGSEWIWVSQLPKLAEAIDPEKEFFFWFRQDYAIPLHVYQLNSYYRSLVFHFEKALRDPLHFSGWGQLPILGPIWIAAPIQLSNYWYNSPKEDHILVSRGELNFTMKENWYDDK
jgi:hypothetical protein